MKILIDKNLVEYKDNLFFDNGNISFEKGKKLHVPTGTKYIVPGFIDRHTHGGYGIDFMDGDPQGNKKLISQLLKEGITTVLPTTLTQKEEAICCAIEALDNVTSDGRIWGIHLEGPYINPAKCGAQNPKYIQSVNTELLEKYSNTVKMVSYAPELDKDDLLINYTKQKGITASVVHSNASLKQIEDAYRKGLRNFSHFYNGSSTFQHRNPGVVNAGLALNDVYLELICDGYHVDPQVIEFTYKIKGIDGIVLITDSMRAKGCGEGEFDLGGQKAFLDSGAVRLANGSLAGSVLEMNQAVKNFCNFANCSLGEALYAASSNVANSLNISNRGYLREGMRADVVILDEQLEVIETYVNGECAYKR